VRHTRISTSISGEEIMEHNLQPCREIGVLKEAIKAILEGEILMIIMLLMILC
jgi:hypothetical protein